MPIVLHEELCHRIVFSQAVVIGSDKCAIAMVQIAKTAVVHGVYCI